MALYVLWHFTTVAGQIIVNLAQYILYVFLSKDIYKYLEIFMK